MDVNELFQEMENNNVLLYTIDETAYCTLDEQNREIILPSEYQIIGVESDEKVERLKFQFPKIVGDNIDLSQLSIRINYKNANGEIDKNVAENITSYNESIYFDWVLTRKVTKYKGTVNFIVCAVKTNSDGTITNEWNTTLAKSEVLEGLEVSGDVIEQENPDIIEYILSKLDEIEQGGIPGQDGEDGGYYTPTVTQPTDETMQMSFAASKPSMPPVQPVTINLPIGGDALNGLPSGGTTGQVLSKKTNTDYDVEWTDAPVGGDTPRQEMQSTDTTVTLQPNILYVFPEMASLTVTLAEPSNTDIVNEWHWFFDSGETACVFSLQNQDGSQVYTDAYSIDANMRYEVSVLNSVAYIKGVAITSNGE